MKQPLDHLKSLKKPMHKSVYFAGDNALAEQVEATEEELRRLQAIVGRSPVNTAGADKVLEKEAELKQLRQDLRDTQIHFEFHAIRRERFDELVMDHPPTEDQIKQAASQGVTELNYNTLTYPVALICECMEGLDSDEDKAAMTEWLRTEAWNNAELIEMFGTCMAVNNSRSLVSLGKD